MIVYGDREHACCAREVTRALCTQLAEADALTTTLARRAHWARLLIDVGTLAQALLDLELERLGHDGLSLLSVRAHEACLEAGRCFLQAHREQQPVSSGLSRALSALSTVLPDRELTLRDPEGYAFYALYPELYLEAARGVSTEDVQVIGIRSIGTSLGGLVAAALDSTRLPLTVRPVGHPFARTLAVSAEVDRALFSEPRPRCYAIVDEGPGLSGSSFAAVQRYLEEHQVERSQIVLFPSHDNEPGERATEAVREQYRQTRRCTSSFESYFDGVDEARAPCRRFDDLTGPPLMPVRDLSAGRWRPLLYPDPALYPPSYARDERRKYLLTTERGTWLAKFSGLGGSANTLAERVRTLSEAGFTPAWCGARHGFTLTRFEVDARPLPLSALSRAQLVSGVARYLAFLARHFAVQAGLGADLSTLLAMSRHNTTELLGSEADTELTRFEAYAHELANEVRPVRSDSKLEAFEWLVCPDGRLLKCDADDHHAGHDCIGCQDAAWDVAGATVELALSGAEREVVLAALFDAAGVRLSEPKLQLYELAYCAFRAGRAHFGEQAMQGWANDDAQRIALERARYVARLRTLLGID